jgi:uncharacterized SAM-binding protein YcdF (DUF218 family)
MVYLLKMFSTLFLWILIAISLGLVIIRNVRKDGFKEKCGWYLSFTAVLILFLFSTKPVSNLLIYSLEHDYQLPSKKTLSNLDAVVILAGGVRPCSVFASGAEASGATYSRLVSGVYIFKENNVKLLVMQGTSRVNIESDAVVMAGLAEQLGVPRDRIIIETNSRNTFEHAIELRKIFPASKKMRLGVVTSAMHMRRSEMVFKWKFPEDVIVPIPVDHRYSVLKYGIEDFIPSLDAFAASNDAVHELVGMVWYSLKHYKEK